jgi:hypothetical protein
MVGEWSSYADDYIWSNQADFQQASLAQLVERGTSNAEVTGSTPLGGMSFCSFLHYLRLVTFFLL